MTVLVTVPATSPDTSPQTTPARARGSEFSELSRQVRSAGLLNRSRTRQLARIVFADALLAATWLAFFLVGDTWWQLLTAALLAVGFTQAAFVGHDAGHQQLSRGRRRNDAVGLLQGNLLVGLSYGWWVDKHNRHHSSPNQVGKDPDVAAGFFVFTAAEARPRQGAARWLTRHQAYLFFPMLLLEGLNLHVEAVRDLARRRGREATTEMVLLFAHIAAYVTAVAVVLPPGKAVAFVAVHQALFGLYMGCAFAPNHKGMLISVRSQPCFLRRQVLTSRNIRGGRLTDVFFGGLNYQIEHHLFPTMPRSHLRRAQPLVREFCRVRGISYHEDSALGSYRQALRHLHSVSAPLRRSNPEKRMITAADSAGARE